MLKTINTTTTSQPTDATKAAPAIMCLITFISSREAGKTKSIDFSMAVLINSTQSITTLAIASTTQCQNFNGSHTPTIMARITRAIITRKFCSASIIQKSPPNACLKLLISFGIFNMSIFTTSLEPILSKISDQRKSLRPAAFALNRARAAGLRLRLAGKKFPPPNPLHFCPLAKKSSCEKLKNQEYNLGNQYCKDSSYNPRQISSEKTSFHLLGRLPITNIFNVFFRVLFCLVKCD